MTIHTIDRTILKQLEAGTKAALKPFADSLGLEIAVAGGAFDAGMYRPRVTYTVKQTADGLGANEAAFKKNAQYLGLSPSDFGRSFSFAGKTFTISGLNLNARRKPIIATGPGGKEYVFSAIDVHRLLTA